MNKGSNNQAPPEAATDHMSFTSKLHDNGNKGYLNDVEAELRQRDTHNQGELTNSQVRQVTKDYLDAQQQSQARRNWAIVLAILLVLSSVANIGTAYLAVSLNKDMQVSVDNFLQSTKAGDTLATRSVGVTINLETQIDPLNNSTFACVPMEAAASIWLSTQQGSNVLLATKNVNSSQQVITELAAGGSFADEEQACFPKKGSTTGETVRIIFNSNQCGGQMENGGRRRLFEEHIRSGDHVAARNLGSGHICLPYAVCVPVSF